LKIESYGMPPWYLCDIIIFVASEKACYLKFVADVAFG